MTYTQRFLSLDDLQHLPAPRWLVKDLFEVNSLVMLAGPPGSYKSFLALDWMLCMATGRSWHGRPCVPSRVLYVLGEGKASLLKRIQMWAQYYKPTQEEKQRLVQNFRVTFEVPQMAMRAMVDTLLKELEDESFAPEVIVLDTFARSFVGLDENSQKDTGLWIESADRLRQLGYSVLFVHHTAKNTEFGLKYRGSTAIMGAMDTAMTLERDYSTSTVCLKVIKQKDHDEGDPLYFKRVIVMPHGGEGEGSIVLEPTAKPEKAKDVAPAGVDAHITALMADVTFESDRARARALRERVPDLTEAGAQSRVSHARRKRVSE